MGLAMPQFMLLTKWTVMAMPQFKLLNKWTGLAMSLLFSMSLVD